MSAIVLCCDCAHVVPGISGRIDDNSRCAMFKGPTNPVTGEQMLMYAQVARESDKACTMNALKYTPREKAVA